MEEDREEPQCGVTEAGLKPVPPPNLVTLCPFTPKNFKYSRRLSSRFAVLNRPVRFHVARELAWVSLQGLLVGAEEATSAKTIGGGLSRDEAVVWELFSPMHRILIVAVVAVAVANSKKTGQIYQLRKCVQLRDEILSSMQQKLDNLCEQMNNTNDPDLSAAKIVKVSLSEASEPNKPEFVCTDCWLCDQHRSQSSDLLGNSTVKVAGGDEMLNYKTPLSNGAEQEERRMSDLSDWASSATSTADIQLNNLAIELDLYNLKKEREEKDAAIKELSALILSKDIATSKRIEELEHIIRRKNMIITKLRKDMIVLEQKVVQLTRSKRPSFSGSSSESKQLPTMSDNLLFDMDSTTSPSSSDSDCSTEKQKKATAHKREESFTSEDTIAQSIFINECASHTNHKLAPAKISTSLVRSSEQHPRSRPVSPRKEKLMNQNQLSANGDIKKGRRRLQVGLKGAASQKRWA
ncbi:hypothetical protein Nepgr_001912 [Nepenthes gracilis]|uniref:Uncharacterized protein n=1 Tax=Nepenthes gracilis TaxID=150966 RepID=A0AAD3P5Z1_NEPGR|nr:hypothetical protein Nepgr_001912 [Nepenthes gracilis]